MADIDGGATFLRMVAYVLDRCERLESQQAVSGAWGAGQLAAVNAEKDQLRAQIKNLIDRAQQVAAHHDGQCGKMLELERQLRLVTLERDELRAERDALQRRFDAIPRLQPRPMTADGEPFGDSEELAEPYQWQVGDEIECRGVTRRLVELVHGGWVTLQGVESPMSQPDWERRGWKLHREAATISDSVGADVEGQS